LRDHSDVIVLHATWLDRPGRLAVWAERGGRPRAPARRRGRPPSRPRPASHPFAVSPDGIRHAIAALGGLGLQDAVAKSSDADLLLRLPSAGDGPASSPWLEDDLSAFESTSTIPEQPLIRWWKAPGVVFEASDAVDLVTTLTASAPSEVGSDPSGIAVAADLRFAALAAEMATEMITRGRVLPAVVRTDAGWQAVWRPIVGVQDRGRIQALLWAIPMSFVSGQQVDTNRSPGVDQDAETVAEMFRSYFWTVADSLVRRFVAERQVSTTKLPERVRRPAKTKSSVVAAWLAALASADRTVFAADDDLRALCGALEAWHRTENAESEPVRTCFRIVPPADDTVEAPDTWSIEFALQAVDDPSLLVSAESVWADGPELTALERHVMHPDEHLLKGLGRATRLVPSLGPALTAAEPCAQVTDAEGALEFLRNGAPILEQAGFGVLAPPWWRSSRARLGLKLKARTRSPGGVKSAAIGLQSLCDVRWEAALGDAKIGLAELRQLASLKQPLVRLRGQWVELQEGDIAAAITAVTTKRDGAGRMTAGEVVRNALGIESTDGQLPIVGVDADGWLGDLLAGADDRRLKARETPEGFVGRLRPYQERGLAWLAFLGELGLGACLADDMGLGKTAQLLALLIDERPEPKGPALVVCPMSLVGNWQREAARFTPELSVYVHHGPERLRGKAFTRHAKRMDLVLSTYGLAARDQQLFETVAWSRLALDEAQQIKNSAARTTQSVRSIAADRRIAMTGTPVENRLSEMWSIMQFLNPGLLGSEKGFRERFAIPIERDGDDEAAERLRRITAPFVLRRLKTDRSIIADLPDKLEMKEFCTLTREQASLYQAVVDDMLARIDEAEGIERRGLVLATMLKLKQVCNHPAHFLADGSSLPGRSGKLTRLVEVLEEAVSEGDRALVFTQFVEMGNLLERHLLRHLRCDVLWLHGGVPKSSRDKLVERYQNGDGPAVFLLSLKAGGTGLNLTAATHVVHFDRWWNPAVEDQATDRAFRIGQKRNVQVRKFVCGGTLEERIDEMIEHKRALAERIVGTGEGWLTEMSTEQLREVIALSADAVADVQ
jgi:SNF2 family DNA or RNA helicase